MRDLNRKLLRDLWRLKAKLFAIALVMACGVGGCAGCTLEIRTPGGPAMKRVCVDGPVFDSRSVY